MRSLPYPALRAAEAVIRLRSFSRAAEELGMTQSAVSQHVRAMEDWLGRTLILRGGRSCSPTPDGQRLAEAMAEGVGLITAVIDDLRGRENQAQVISVACPPGFAVNWLFPRLLNFDHDHPDLPVSILTQPDQAVFETGRADVAIRYGASGPVGLHAEKLMGEEVYPVCTAEIAKDLRDPASLAHYTLLTDIHESRKSGAPTWEGWARAVGVELPARPRMRRFSQSNLSIQAALQGAGVALGRGPLVQDALASGALVRPFKGVAASPLFYWFACRKVPAVAPGAPLS